MKMMTGTMHRPLAQTLYLKQQQKTHATTRYLLLLLFDKKWHTGVFVVFPAFFQPKQLCLLFLAFPCMHE
jgi:hypothetical protein